MDQQEYLVAIIDEAIRELATDMSYPDRFSYIRQTLNEINDAKSRNYVENILLAYLNATSSSHPPTEQKITLLLIHGIRSYGPWQDALKELLSHRSDVVVYPIKYNYVDLLRFFFSRKARNLRINRIRDELIRAELDHKDSMICVIAHSFGTYLVANALNRFANLRIDRLLLSGSIVQRDNQWETGASIVSGSIVNDCGIRDMMPVYAQFLSGEYGNTGRFGFGRVGVSDRFHDVNHGGFFTTDFMSKYWVSYVLDGEVVSAGHLPRENRLPFPVSLISAYTLRQLIFGMAVIVLVVIGAREFFSDVYLAI